MTLAGSKRWHTVAVNEQDKEKLINSNSFTKRRFSGFPLGLCLAALTLHATDSKELEYTDFSTTLIALGAQHHRLQAELPRLRSTAGRRRSGPTHLRGRLCVALLRMCQH